MAQARQGLVEVLSGEMTIVLKERMLRVKVEVIQLNWGRGVRTCHQAEL